MKLKIIIVCVSNQIFYNLPLPELTVIVINTPKMSINCNKTESFNKCKPIPYRIQARSINAFLKPHLSPNQTVLSLFEKIYN